MIGRTLAHYEIVDLLGRGGMGEVYRARDTTLGREVALKVLPREMSGDPERLARFSREARSLAALQHANVASIYGFEEADGVRFLVMELVEGEDLAVRLRKGALPLATALEYARQIAEGLEAAHEKGIVHRDLKPANVKLTPEGSVKILDFGLARAAQGDGGSDGDLANSPTITAAMTQVGVILGTAAYMSPEQARGGVADARADIWAFGVVLWEMITGQRLFEGETVSDTLASILKLPPDWSTLPDDTPVRVRELLERCLAKKRRDRLGSIADARLELEWTLAGRGEPESAAGSGTRSRRRSLRSLVAVVPLLLLAFVVGRQSSAPPPPPSIAAGDYALSVPIPDDMVHLGDLISPDGRWMAVRMRPRKPDTPADAGQAIYVRPLDRDEFRRVDASLDVRGYGFSDDGRWIGLVAPATRGSSQLRFWRVPADGSAPATSLFDWSDDWSRLFLWLPDGDLLVDLDGTRIQRLPTDGRPPADPIALQVPAGLTGFETYPLQNSVLPGGKHVLTWSHSYATGRYDQTGAVLDLETGAMRILMTDTGRLHYWPTGHLVFGRSSTLLAVAFDPEKLEVSGPVFAVGSGIRQSAPWEHPDFDLSRNGTLVYYPGEIGGDERWLAWLDPDLSVNTPWSDDRQTFMSEAHASSVGNRLVITVTGNDGLFSVWTSGLENPRLQPWIEQPGRDCEPLCLSRDGTVALYIVTDGEQRTVYVRDARGADLPVMAISLNTAPQPACLVDDETALLFTSWIGEPSIRLVPLPRGGAAEATPPDSEDLPRLISNASEPAISPDGAWLAYTSRVSGRNEVYVRAWSGRGELGPPLRVSREGGHTPAWYAPPGQPLQIRFDYDESVLAAEFQPEHGRALQPTLVRASMDPVLSVIYLDDGRILGLVRDEDEAPVESIGLRIGFGRELSQKLTAQQP